MNKFFRMKGYIFFFILLVFSFSVSSFSVFGTSEKIKTSLNSVMDISGGSEVNLADSITLDLPGLILQIAYWCIVLIIVVISLYKLGSSVSRQDFIQFIGNHLFVVIIVVVVLILLPFVIDLITGSYALIGH